MDEESKQRLADWLCGKLNPPGWPILRIEMRQMMLEMFKAGKYEELGKIVQATIKEHRAHQQYLSDLKAMKIPEWLVDIPKHPVTVMRNALLEKQAPFWAPLNYCDDPRKHIFN